MLKSIILSAALASACTPITQQYIRYTGVVVATAGVLTASSTAFNGDGFQETTGWIGGVLAGVGALMITGSFVCNPFVDESFVCKL